ncbi:MAG: hypothetical protein RBT60_10430 [Candidatus Krumholzibacteria bacterium]|nr:hypothetical protein [Candidatus Krumholzibacteria bacterium]MDY0110341.1 hypothetical protein [Candidatus Krumholzibacteria bacterium]
MRLPSNPTESRAPTKALRVTANRTPTSVATAVLLVALAVLAPGRATADEPALRWIDRYDGAGHQLDEGIAVLFDANGHPVLGGVRTTTANVTDIFVRKLDLLSGELIWSYVLHDAGGNNMVLADMVRDQRGDILVAGYLSACDG